MIPDTNNSHRRSVSAQAGTVGFQQEQQGISTTML